MKLQFLDKWQKRLGSSYEARIRVTLGLMFLLIIVANLNSLRFFSQSQSLQTGTLKYRVVDNLEKAANSIKANPAELARSAQFRDLAHAAGFTRIDLVETELLQREEIGKSELVDSVTLSRLRNAYDHDKEVAGVVGAGLPATVSEVFTSDNGSPVRAVAYHFIGDKGKGLTLVATLPADTEVGLQRFSRLNTLFQLLSIAAAFTIAILLLKITLKPYLQIKKQALAAAVAKTDQPEAMDFAVQTFQRVITELRHKEAVLQRLYAQQKDRAISLERYNEYILAAMPSAVISCDNEGVVTNYNSAAEAIFKIPASAAIGHNYHYALADYAMFAQMIEDALAKSRESSKPEIEVHLVDQQCLWLSVDCTLLRDNVGAVKGAMVLISDLTDLKRLESEVAIKEQMAALGEMSAGLAHQLRNSLAAVVGFAQLLRKLAVGIDQVPEIVTNILTEAQATEEMLTRFLSLSRHEAVQLQEVDFEEIQRTVETHFASEVESGRVRLQFTVDQCAAKLTCDAVLISNVLVNLVQNSIEASVPGSEVKIRVYSSGFGETVGVKVSDNGKGIPPENIDEIFLPFFTSGKPNGTGLGLALVRKWIVCHGGEVTCESAPNRGTTFTIMLPQKRGNDETARPCSKINLAKV